MKTPKTDKKMTPDHTLPIIAIVGRPNVGKSSLFNRIIGKRYAIESEIAGTTRDRIYYHTGFGEIPTVLVDTGGLEYGKKENIEGDIQAQVQLAIQDADLIYFVVDAKEGLTVSDYEAANLLRKSKKPVIFIANKIDVKGASENLMEYGKLGFGEPIGISAYHKIGTDTLVEATEEKLTKLGYHKPEKVEEKPKTTNICFLGRPNVGKSSLVNALLGKPKIIVSEIAGTTRDSTDTEITWNEKQFNLIDTAGLRKRGKIEPGLEKFSTLRSLEAIERADIVCLIMDFAQGIRKQDQHIASYIIEAGKGLMLIINKTDLMEDREREEQRMINILRSRFDFLPWAPVLFVSALKKTNIEKMLELSEQIQVERFHHIDSDELDGFMKETVMKSLPPVEGDILPRFFSLEQTDINPPTFTFQVNNRNAIHFSYRRYLENSIRKRWAFNGTVIKLVYKDKLKKKE